MITKFDNFINEEWNPFKKDKYKVISKKLMFDRKGYIKFLLPSGNEAYLKDDIIDVKCGVRAKISEIFSDIGMDDEGHFIANCLNCKKNGVNMEDHVKI